MSDAQGRLVVVSNRVINPKKPAAGGLAVALGEMMSNTDGLWFGWSGKTIDEADSKIIKTEPFGCSTLATVDLSQQQHDNYYAGFSNSVLWPIFHEEVEWADLDPKYYKAYEQVNKMFASQLLPMLKDNDLLWIHDYHLIPLAQELRALGCKQRIGFFNHIPLPPPEFIKQIPQHRQLMEALFSYDLIGMQSVQDLENLRQYVETEDAGQRLAGPFMDAFGKKSSVQTFPIGIDVKSLKTLEPGSDSQDILNEVNNESCRRKLMIGVDRLDYTKGIPTRLEAFYELLATHPEEREKVTLVQITAPTRQGVFGYDELNRKTCELVNKINDRFGTENWKPVMHFNMSVERNALPELYRRSRVGVVTSKVDGMNLVAKEFVAAQQPKNPGVLVLSRKTGAAFQLPEAILVDPNDHIAIANAYKRALDMPLKERKERYAALLNNVETEDLSWWRGNFLASLFSVPSFSTMGDQRAVIEDAFTTSDGTSSQAASLDQISTVKAAAAHPELNAIIANFSFKEKSLDEIDQMRQLIDRILNRSQPIDRSQYAIDQFSSYKDKGSSSTSGLKRIKDYLDEDDQELGRRRNQAIQSIRDQIARILEHLQPINPSTICNRSVFQRRRRPKSSN